MTIGTSPTRCRNERDDASASRLSWMIAPLAFTTANFGASTLA